LSIHEESGLKRMRPMQDISEEGAEGALGVARGKTDRVALTAGGAAPEIGESLEQYLREVSGWELLTPQAERALAKKTSRGEKAALEELVLRNLRLVIYWAKRYRSTGLPLQDLIQEGNIGLMRAAEKFDPGKGTRFSTYASWWIRQALARAICDKQDLIRIPVHMHQKLRRVDRMLEGTRGVGDRPLQGVGVRAAPAAAHLPRPAARPRSRWLHRGGGHRSTESCPEYLPGRDAGLCAPAPGAATAPAPGRLEAALRA
jgi:RNA polymerase sigma factor (sigma-70 family)